MAIIKTYPSCNVTSKINYFFFYKNNKDTSISISYLSYRSKISLLKVVCTDLKLERVQFPSVTSRRWRIQRDQSCSPPFWKLISHHNLTLALWKSFCCLVSLLFNLSEMVSRNNNKGQLTCLRKRVCIGIICSSVKFCH